MTEQDIVDVISNDSQMMDVLRIAEELNLPDWLIGAGFVRNKVWNYLHGYTKEMVDTADIDLIYYDAQGNNEDEDKKLSEDLHMKTGLDWEVVNEYYAHKWHAHRLQPYTSSEDALSKWPETVTCVGVRIENGKLKLIAPHGIDDLVNLIIRPNKDFIEEGNSIDVIAKRIASKKWQERWPKLKLEIE